MGFFSRLFGPLPTIQLSCTSDANGAFGEERVISIPVDKYVSYQNSSDGGITLTVDDDPRSPFETKLCADEITKMIDEARLNPK